MIASIGNCTPSYDLDGDVQNDCMHSYAWDANGRPVTADGVGLTYDALGRMVEQNRSGAYTEIVYSPTGAKLALMNGTTLVKGFVPLTGGAMAVYNSTGLAYYRHADWLRSSRFASTPSRTMYSDTAYAPFGEAYAQAGTTDLSFTGMNQDTVANLYDFPAREYGIQGRWPSPDPAGVSSMHLADPQTLNRYAYVRNSPLRIVDPVGLDGLDYYDCEMNPCSDEPTPNEMIADYMTQNCLDGSCENGALVFNADDPSQIQAEDPTSLVDTPGATPEPISLGGGLDAASGIGSIADASVGYPGGVGIDGIDQSMPPEAFAVFGQLNQMDIGANTAKLYALSVVAGAGAAVGTAVTSVAWPAITSAASATWGAMVGGAAVGTELLREAIYNPKVWDEAKDFVMAFVPDGSPPEPTWGGMIGFVIDSWPEIRDLGSEIYEGAQAVGFGNVFF